LVSRRVKPDEVRRAQQQLDQRVAVALAARKHADALENVVFAKQKAAEQPAEFRLCLGAAGARDTFEDDLFDVEFLVGLPPGLYVIKFGYGIASKEPIFLCTR